MKNVPSCLAYSLFSYLEERTWHWVVALIKAKSQDQIWDNELQFAFWCHLASLLSHPTLLDLSFFIYKMNGLGDINSFPRWSRILVRWDYLSRVPRNKWQYHNNDKTGKLWKLLTWKKWNNWIPFSTLKKRDVWDKNDKRAPQVDSHKNGTSL